MPQYYRLDGRRITLREYRRVCPSLLMFLIVAGLRLVGVTFRFTGLMPYLDRLYEVSWDDLPQEDYDALAGPVAGWERLGFRRLFVHDIPTPQRNRSGSVVVLLSPGGEAFVQLAYIVRPDGRFVWTGVFSRFPDGSYGLTTDQKHELNDPPECRRSQQPPGLTPEEMWERHRENLKDLWGNEGLSAERLSDARVRQLVLEIEQAEADYQAARGVFVPVLDEDELEDLIAKG